MARTAPATGVARLAIDPGSRTPLQLQIYDRLRTAVLAGVIPGGARLPSTRVLAAELGLSRTTVVAAYDQLLAEGYIESRVGAGTRVVAALPEKLLTAPRQGTAARAAVAPAGARAMSARGARMAETRFGPEFRTRQRSWRAPFRVAVPALDAFPFEIWSRLVARQMRRASDMVTDYHDARGARRLRRAIAAHLALARGIRCDADQVLVTAGAQSAIDLAVRLLLDPGDKVLVENPSHLGFHGALKGAGAEILPVPVDAEGMVVGGRGFAAGARLACVTPSNQFPLAVTMSLTRRLALLGWARRTAAWVLEDDYDSEFRFVGRPIEALQALDREGRVLYLGSFSKILFPGLRLGYLVLPPDLVDRFAAARRFVDVHPPTLFQVALADFFEEGHFGRHLRRMRVLYAERGRGLKDAVDRHLAGALELAAPEAGMHGVAWLARGLDDHRIAAAAAEAGIEARPLALYGLGAIAPALVLGFGSVPPRAAHEAARRLARVIEAARRNA